MTLQQFFLHVINMSVAASVGIGVVLVLRQLMKKAPRSFSYVLWLAVLVRLLCPVLPSAPMGFIRTPADVFELVKEQESHFSADSKIFTQSGSSETEAASAAGNDSSAESGEDGVLTGDSPAQSTTESGDAAEILRQLILKAERGVYAYIGSGWAGWAAVIWIEGMLLFFLWSVVQYVQLKDQLKNAVPAGNGVWRIGYIDTPFVFGLFAPRIYLPYSLLPSEYAYVLEHERFHIRRGDLWFRLLAMTALCIHWFNPLVWLAYMLSERDMEMSCDEAVTRKMYTDMRADYAQSLLRFSTGRTLPANVPLAFGENGVKERIVHLIRYRKPALWVSALCMAICVTATACVATAPVKESAEEENGSITAEDPAVDDISDEESTVAEEAEINIIAEDCPPELYDCIEPYIDSTLQIYEKEQVNLSVHQVFYDGHWFIAGVSVRGSAVTPQIPIERLFISSSTSEPVALENTEEKYYLITAKSEVTTSAFPVTIGKQEFEIQVQPCGTISIPGDEDFRNITVSPFSIWIDDYTIGSIHDIPKGQYPAHDIYILHPDGTETGYSKEEMADSGNESILWGGNEYLYGDHAYMTVRMSRGIRLADVAGIRIDDRTFTVTEENVE